jgi:hypothetical protein
MEYRASACRGDSGLSCRRAVSIVFKLDALFGPSNVGALRRGPFLAVAWNGWFGS